MSDFSELLQEAERLTSDLGGTIELPKVERSLQQVLEASNDLYSRVAQSGTKDIQANLLLGSKGIDLPKIVQKLESISTKRTFEPIELTEDLDVTNCLENEIRNKIISVFDTGFNEMLEASYKNAWEHQSAEWFQKKRKILYSMSGSSGAFLEFDKFLTINPESSLCTNPGLGPMESIYASKIIEYNSKISCGYQKPNLIEIFNNLSNEFKDAKAKDMWEIISYMVQLPPFPQSEDPIKTRNSKPIIEAMVRQGKGYLEDRYKTYMSNIINENLQQASRGGVPGTYPLVRSFVGLRLQGDYIGLRDGTIDERPLWPMVYYCLRCGDIPAALYCLKKSSSAELADLIQLLEAKANNSTGPEVSKLEDNVRFAYRRYVRNETDPFKRIIWAALSCCDVADEHSEVARTADDYLWLKLSLVRVDFNKEDYIKYSDLQHMIIDEYGEEHYDAFNQPHLYFQVLALTGQFEAAIEFLSRIERFRVHAVHMAIALNEMYMLGGPLNTCSPLMCIDPVDPKPARRLNLARLIMIYVKKFELVCLNETLNYFFLLRNYTDTEGINLFKICVVDLAIETKAYHKILGKVEMNGVRSKGLLDQFNFSEVNAQGVAEMIGNALVKKGLHEEAIDILDIANQQDSILKIFCTLLSQVVQLPPEPNSLREKLYEKASFYAQRFSKEGYKSASATVISFLKLKDLVTFFDHYHGKQFPQAFKVLNSLQLVPLEMADIDERVRTIKLLNDYIVSVIPDILLATMNMLFDQYQKIKGTEYVPKFQEGSIENQLKRLREQAKCITNFTGILPYRMPGDTNSRLVQMEILMH